MYGPVLTLHNCDVPILCVTYHIWNSISIKMEVSLLLLTLPRSQHDHQE